MPAVLCSKCGVDLPDGSQFCLKCGEPVKTAPATRTSLVTTAVLSCSRCGARLADGAQFCSRCHKPVTVPTIRATDSAQSVDSVSAVAIPRPRSTPHHTRRVIFWLLGGLLLVAFFWSATSDNPLAQTVQEFAGWKHDQGLVDAPFSVSSHNLRYYKFDLPQGSMHVSIVGEFSALGEPHTGSGKSSGQQADNNIEVYVMSESAFVAWQNGYATSNVYESGRVSHASLQADLPDGAGIYYLVFNNKFAPSTTKRVTADVLLRYKNWLPAFFRRVSERFWNWLGL